jgi:hypothetical protein
VARQERKEPGHYYEGSHVASANHAPKVQNSSVKTSYPHRKTGPANARLTNYSHFPGLGIRVRCRSSDDSLRQRDRLLKNLTSDKDSDRMWWRLSFETGKRQSSGVRAYKAKGSHYFVTTIRVLLWTWSMSGLNAASGPIRNGSF